MGLAQALRRLTEQDLEETVSTRLLVMAGRLRQRHCPAHRLPGRQIDAPTDDAETAAALAGGLPPCWAKPRHPNLKNK